MSETNPMRPGRNWLEIGIVIAVIGLMAAYCAPLFLEKNQRGLVAHTHSMLRAMATMAVAYRIDNHAYPPATANGYYHGPFVKSLYEPYRIDVESNCGDPPVDPYRKRKVFENESLTKAQYSTREGWVSFKGYPFRYFRSADGQWGILMSNGQDLDVDLTDNDLLPLPEITFKTMWETPGIIAKIYDPSNGIISSGDLVRAFD